MNPEDFKEGQILLIDKDPGWTSFDVVNKIRRALNTLLGIKKIKVGHSGTLDPLASGLVMIFTGRATKKIEQFQGLDKEYIATIRLGATTPSYDLETKIDRTFPVDHISRQDVLHVLESLKGEQSQIPPLYSAKSVDGVRAYDMARKGLHVELKPVQVTIYELELVELELPVLTLRISCSKGTYIRSLARDIGEKLNSGGHLTALRRTKIGSYSVNDAEKTSEFVKKLKPL